jgi:hypothetical protein
VKFNERSLGALAEATDYTSKIIRNWIYAISYGVVVSEGKLAISLTQNNSTEMRRRTYGHTFGNISLYFSL